MFRTRDADEFGVATTQTNRFRVDNDPDLKSSSESDVTEFRREKNSRWFVEA
jgi:hypothetical protein